MVSHLLLARSRVIEESSRNHTIKHICQSKPILQEKKEQGLSGEEIERLTGFIGSLEKAFGACSLALSGKSLLSYGLHASEQL